MTPKEISESLRALSDQIEKDIADSLAAIRAIVAMIDAMDKTATPSAVDVPYRSQWDADAGRFASDCGPACVGMLLAWRCVKAMINDISLEAGMNAQKAYTTGDDLRLAAKKYGLLLEVVSGWTLDQFAKRLPAIVLVHYDDIIGRQDVNYKRGHWLVVIEITPECVTFHDPDWWGAQHDKGAARRLLREVFDKAMTDCALDGNPVGYGLVLAQGAK